MSCLQLFVVFARGDLDEMRKAVEAMEAAGLEAAGARDKLTRIEEALKKVMAHSNARIESVGMTGALNS